MRKNIKYAGYVALVLVALAGLFACSGGGRDLPVGEETLGGVEIDGVRDDVAGYIAENYDDEPTQDALMQYARAEQDFILSDGNKTLAVAAALASDKGRDCLRSTYSVEEVIAITDEMLAASLNTKERMRAYLVADSLLGGHTFTLTPPSERAAMCE